MKKKNAKILAVKPGYNPNSSSIGILVNVFILGTFAVTILYGFLGAYLMFLKKKKDLLTGKEKNENQV